MEEVKKKKTRTVHDVYENIEYIAIYKNKQQLEVLEGKDVNGKTKTELQKYLGNKYGPGTYRLSIKFIGDSKNIVGSLAGIVTNKEINQNTENEKIENILKKIEELASSNKNNVIDFTTLLQMKDETYKIQIDFYRERIKQLESEIERLKQQVNEQDNSQPDLLNILIPLLAKKNENV